MDTFPRSNGTTRDGIRLGGHVAVDLEERDRAVAALTGFFAGHDVELDGRKIPRYRSFREAYVDLTGDRGFTGELQRSPAGKLGIGRTNAGRVQISATEASYGPDGSITLRLAEAGELITTTWAQILGDSITRKMQAEYKLSPYNAWRLIAEPNLIRDFRTQRRMRFGGYGDLADVAELGPYLDMTTPGDEEATYAATKRGGIEVISLEAITNDDVGAIRQIPVRLGRAAARTLYKAVVIDGFAGNPTCSYDATALFHADHDNLLAEPLSAASLIAARIAMFKQLDLSTNDQLGLRARYLWIPPELEQIAYELTSSERTPGTADNDANYAGSLGIQPVVAPYFTDANNWFLTCDKADCPVLEVGHVFSEEPELFAQDNPNMGSMFDKDALTYKVRFVFGVGVLDHRGAQGAIVT